MAVPTIHGFESLVGSTSTGEPKSISLATQTYTAGDYALFIAAAKAAITSVVGATNDTYAQLAQQTNVDSTLALYEGTINGGALDASATVDQSVAERAVAGLITIAGAAANASQPHVLGADTAGTSNDPSAAGLTTTIADCLVMAIIAASGSHNLTTLNAALPATWTLLGSWRSNTSDGPSNDAHTTVAIAYKAMASPGATGAATWTDSLGASQEWTGKQIAIAPVAVAAASLMIPFISSSMASMVTR